MTFFIIVKVNYLIYIIIDLIFINNIIQIFINCFGYTNINNLKNN